MFNLRRVLVMLIAGLIITLTVRGLPLATFNAGPGSAERGAISTTTSAGRSELNGRSAAVSEPNADEASRAGVRGDHRSEVGGRSPFTANRSPHFPNSDTAESAGSAAGALDDVNADQRFSSKAIGWESGSIGVIGSTDSVVPTGVRVRSLGIDAQVEPVGVDSHGDMVIPDLVNHVGWYRHGSVPGESGSAVIAGHLDDYEGKSVFFDLAGVDPGAVVEVRLSDGRMSTFQVTGKTSFPADQLPADEVFARDGESRLALLTCGGDWNHSANRYEETVVVYAKPIG